MHGDVHDSMIKIGNTLKKIAYPDSSDESGVLIIEPELRWIRVTFATKRRWCGRCGELPNRRSGN